MSNQKYTTEFKKQVVEFYLDHHTVKETVSEFNIPESTLFVWKHQYQTHMFEKPCSTKSSSLKHMQRKLDRMKAVFEAQSILKCSPNASNAEKVKSINSLKDCYSVRILCNAVNLPTSSYYHYKRRETYRTLYEHNDELIKPLIKEIFENSEYRLGKRPIKRILAERGYRVAEERVARLMKEMSLAVQAPMALSHHKKPISRPYYQNRLHNEYDQIAPNAVLVSDITYIRAGQENKFVCVIIDLFSRMVISYAVSDRIDTMLIIETFSKAFQWRGEPKSLMFHSDQGVQYTCHAFREFLKECSVTQSFATPGTPTENAVCEAFFSRMKYEALYRQTYSSIKEIDEEVKKYIDYYNNRRPHRRLNFKSPADVEAAYYESLKA